MAIAMMKMLIALASQRLKRFIWFYFFKSGVKGQGKRRLFLDKGLCCVNKKRFHIKVTLRIKIM